MICEKERHERDKEYWERGYIYECQCEKCKAERKKERRLEFLERKEAKRKEATREKMKSKQTKKKREQQLHTYIANHDGYYMGGISVVTAQNRAKARRMVRKAIKERYAEKGWATPETLPVTLIEVPTDSHHIQILWDGDY